MLSFHNIPQWTDRKSKTLYRQNVFIIETERMRIHYFQHVPFEGPASVEHWSTSKGHTLTGTQLYRSDLVPNPEDIDMLVVMGGPMFICEEEKYPWLVKEKSFIRSMVKLGKPIIGICLGAQLIANALGSTVYRNKHKEIGWYPVNLTDNSRFSTLSDLLPKKFNAFHWHSDTFDLPEGAVHLARSDGCENQAFLYNERILGLQFHLESTATSVRQLVQNCKDEIDQSVYVQSEDQILSAQSETFHQINDIMYNILDRLLILK